MPCFDGASNNKGTNCVRERETPTERFCLSNVGRGWESLIRSSLRTLKEETLFMIAIEDCVIGVERLLGKAEEQQARHAPH
jgi:hypothetical protein